MMRFFTATMLIITVFLGCSRTNVNEMKLQDNKILKNYFNDNEILELSDIVTFFDSKVQESYSKKTLNDCYKSYFANFETVFKEKGIQIDTVGYRELLNSLDTKVFDNIWGYAQGHLRKSNTVSYEKQKHLELNVNGKYFKFLSEYSKKNKDLSVYVSSIKTTSCIAPVSIADFLTNYKKFDFNNELNRLIFAVHFITLGK